MSALDGVDLDGRRASAVMEGHQRPSYALTVARAHAPARGEEPDELPVGDKCGWLHLTRAKLLFVGGLTAVGPSHKCWANLSEGTLSLYEEVVRGERLDGHAGRRPWRGVRCIAANVGSKACRRR